MKLTRRQLKKLINEIYVASPEGVISGEESDRSPSIRVDARPFGTAPKRSHISPEVEDLLNMDDPSYTKQAYELSDLVQDYPEGTAKTAVDDENFAMIMSKLSGTPLESIVSSPPKGFKFGELLEGINHITGAYYVGVQFFSEAGGLGIDVTLDNISASRRAGMDVMAFVLDQNDGYWDFYDSRGVEDIFEDPDEARAQIEKLAAELRQKFPGF